MECPHCNGSGVSSWSKFMAGTSNPAKCKLCGKLSSVSGILLGVKGAVYNFVVLVAVFASFYYRSWWPLLATFIVIPILEFIVLKFVPLQALSEEEVLKSKKLFFIFFAAFVLLLIIVGLADV